MKKNQFSGSATLWEYPGEQGSWHFLTLPKIIAEEIRTLVPGPRRGFGAVKVEVTIGKTTWQTSIFPDKQSGSYLLPVKASVRRAEDLWSGEIVRFSISLV